MVLSIASSNAEGSGCDRATAVANVSRTESLAYVRARKSSFVSGSRGLLMSSPEWRDASSYADELTSVRNLGLGESNLFRKGSGKEKGRGLTRP